MKINLDKFDKVIKLLDEPVALLCANVFFIAINFFSCKISLSGVEQMNFGGYENFNYISIFRYINLLKLNKLVSKTKNIFNLILFQKII